MKKQLAIVAICILMSVTKANEKNVSIEIDPNLQLFNTYVDIDRQLMNFVDRNVKKMLPYVLEASEHINISSSCTGNLFQLMSGLRKLTDWSIAFIDATGKPQSGLLAGNLQMHGESKQCFDISVKNKNKIPFRGQYCSIIAKPLLPDLNYYIPDINHILGYVPQNSSGVMKFVMSKLHLFYVFNPRLGLCVPSGCTKQDLSQMLNYITQNTYINATVAYCVKKEETYFMITEKIIVICIIAFLGILVIISTILDNTLAKWKNKNLDIASRILQCFSITRNFPKLVNTSVSSDAISCFYGIRILSTFWIILVHEYVVQAMVLMSNHALDLEAFLKGFFSQIVLSGFTPTEVFFLLGGFVNCYSRMKIQKSGKSQPSPVKLIIHRLWRIYPTVSAGFLMSVLMMSSQAPYYEGQSRLDENCRKYWWRHYLFINNFYPISEGCISHTWYLCVDMQVFLLSLITVPVLLRNEKLGVYLHIGIIFLGNICCFCLWWIKDLAPMPSVLPVNNIKHLNLDYIMYQIEIYMFPFLHIASYNIGILFGYLIATEKGKKFSKAVLVFGMLVASFMYTLMIFLPYRWNSGNPYTKVESSLYGSWSKSVIVLAVAWMAHCCITGQAKFINYILSLKIWIPLSRLNFMMYIISIIIQLFYLTNMNFPPDFTIMYLVWTYFGNLCITILMSLVLVLLIESPFIALEKMIFRRGQIEKKSPPAIQKEITLNITNQNGFNPNENTTATHF